MKYSLKQLNITMIVTPLIVLFCCGISYASQMPILGWATEGWTYCTTDQEREGRQLACYALAKQYCPVIEKAHIYQEKLYAKVDKHHIDFIKWVEYDIDEYRVNSILKMITDLSKKIYEEGKKYPKDVDDFRIYLPIAQKTNEDKIEFKEAGLYEKIFGGGVIRENMDRKRAKYYHEEYVKKKEIWGKIINNQLAALDELERQFILLKENDCKRQNEIIKNKLEIEEGYDLSGDDDNTLLVKEHSLQYGVLQNAIKHKRESTSCLVAMAYNTDSFFDKLDNTFEEETELSKDDYLVMCLAVVLQIARQNLFLLMPAINNQQANDTLGFSEIFSIMDYKHYNPSLVEVISDPVPCDVIRNFNGRLNGYNSDGHRVITLGHDSLLGLIVGTANIATRTVTTSDLMSYHLTTENKMGVFDNKASVANTAKVFFHFISKIVSKNTDDKKIVATAFVKQLLYMATDLSNRNSLSLPYVGLFDGLTKRWGTNPMGLGDKLSSLASNTSEIILSAGSAFAINRLIEWLHYALCYDGSTSENLFALKTKKVVCYSNLLASGVNIGEIIVLRNLKLADLSGYLISIAEAVTSVSFARQVKRDFVFGEYDAALVKYCCESVRNASL